ncbi:hypothetical protein [Mucilaginibacter sp.]
MLACTKFKKFLSNGEWSVGDAQRKGLGEELEFETRQPQNQS